MVVEDREDAAIAVFGTWMIIGLFLDGWAHQADKPETFFSPWHGILYSGFGAAVAWFAWDGWRQRRSGQAKGQPGPSDGWVTAGFVVFIAGAVGDGIWHEVFGIEVDLEALVSPSHLALLIGGFLMVTSPVRAAAGDAVARWPHVVTLTLAAALVLFFTQYLSVFDHIAAASHPFIREWREVVDLSSVLVTNAILIVPLLFVLWRWRTPFGAATLLFSAPALGLSGLNAFDRVELVVPFVLGGLVADVLAARGTPPVLVVSAASFVLWSSFFAFAEWSYGVAWSLELWSGAIVLATASSALLSALTRPPVRRAVNEEPTVSARM